MDLHVTWEKYPGTNVTYVVEYRVYQSGNPFTVFGTVTTNYVTIPGVPKNFYEVRVKADCAEGDSDYIYKIAGEDPCEDIIIGSYTVVEDLDSHQKIIFNFDNVLPDGAILRVTNTNNNQVILTTAIPYTSGIVSYTVTLPKIEGQTTVYKVEITNQCSVLDWQLVGEFSIVGPPAKILTTFRYGADFCAPPPYNTPEDCEYPSSGVRMTFSEPLPQPITIVFDYCIGWCFGNNFTRCASNRPSNIGGPRYYSLTVPAGVTNYGACFWRDGAEECATISWCIVNVTPTVLNNGKVIKFDNTNMCTGVLNIPIVSVDSFKNCVYSS